jgi:hypothetical protein
MPSTTERDGIELQAAQFAMILSGIDLKRAHQRKRFQHASGIPKTEENRP